LTERRKHAKPLEPSAALAELSPLSQAERVRAILTDPRFRSPELCRRLLAESRGATFLDGTAAVDWASLAWRLAEGISPESPALRAEALVGLGNAYRLIGELRAAEEAFFSAEPLLGEPGAASPAFLVEVYGMGASLHLAQGRLPEAQEKIRRALALAAELGDRHQVGRLLVKEAKIVEAGGDLAASARLLTQAAQEIDPAGDPEIYRIARFNLLAVLLLQGRYEAAQALLPEVAALFADEPEASTHRLRLRWSEGLIARGFHRLDDAEEAFQEVQREFARRQMGYDAALVAIDLGIVYLETGEAKPLRRLARDLHPVYAAKDLSKEAFACLLVYQDACQSAKLTSRLARELALFMREDRRRPPAQRVAFREELP
jgi:tetratricopeptide (TPR) repeat protein